MPTTGGSRALVGSMAPDDAFTVARLRAAGAVILAKANLSELARGGGVTISSLMGQTLNPYDLTRTPGGSSGGTGAAVAALFGIAGTGTDTGQSTRSPASANNGVGIRPTFGLISRDGIIPSSYTQDTAGPITRYVTDAAIMMDAMVGFDAADTSTWAAIGKAPKSYAAGLDAHSLKGARIGYVTNLFGEGSHPEHAVVKAVTMKAVAAMRAQGAEMLALDIPEANAARDGRGMSVSEFETRWVMDEYFASLGPTGKYHNLQEYVAAAGDTHPGVLRGLQKVVSVKDARHDPEFSKRLARQAQFRDALLHVMEQNKLDALFFTHQRRLVVPASPDADQVERNGFMASSTGLPAITVQGGFSPATQDAPIGVPVGVEFLGRPFSEAQLINLAYGLEQATKPRRLPKSTPPLSGEKFEY
jgi:Asp-tRNA(Asn)/Glu-tRNA(Gln) amidotransferase A subunit family amidase